jgi:excisionase family DNA binding protein
MSPWVKIKVVNEWLTLGQAAKHLGIAQSTARKWADEGKLPSHKTPGGHRRFLIEDLDQLMGTNSPERVHGWDGGRPEVLIVDDEPGVRMLLCEVFVAEGFRVREAASASAGILEINKGMPDLVLLDINMPGMDGLQMLQKIRERIELERMPILVFSGVVDRAELSRALRYGAQGWTSKPFDPFQLVRQAKALLQARTHA